MAKGWTVEKTTNEPKAEAPVVAPVLVTMSPEQLQALITALPASSPAAGLTAEALADILKANRQEQESRRSVRHSNADHEHVSVFSHPLGDLKQPKPRLHAPDGRNRETFFNNHIQSVDDLTPLEVDCFNAITTTCSARGETWKARVDQDGRRLRVDVPSYTIDERMELPSMVEILTELAQGPKAVTPLDMIARIAELERLVKESQAVSA
jgi:hypothetical protein